MATNKNPKRKTLKEQYQQQLNRINRAIKRVSKEGFDITNNILPKVPKKITKQSVSKLEKITPKVIRKKSYKEAEPKQGKVVAIGNDIVNIKTGEIKGQIQPEPVQSNLPSFSKMVISNFLSDLTRFPAVAYPLFKQWIDSLLAQYHEDDIAEMLENAKGNGLFPDYTVAYNRDALLGMIAEMMEYLPDASEWFKQELSDKLEYSEDWEMPN